MTIHYRAILCGAGALTIGLGSSIPAFADAAAQPGGIQLTEIVVTAEKRRAWPMT